MRVKEKPNQHFFTSPLDSLDDLRKVLIKKGPVSEETSLRELEENYARKSDWKVIEMGGVLSIPDEEFRMINLPQPDHSGKIDFGRRQKGAGRLIEDYCSNSCKYKPGD